jgi:hypothetical protein
MKKQWIILTAACFVTGVAIARETDLSIRSNGVAMNPNTTYGLSPVAAKNMALTDKELKNYNYQTRAAFYSDFGNIPITGWEVSSRYDKISFMKNGVEYTAYYDLSSELVGTISNASVADLPGRAVEYINKKYGGYTIGDVVFFDDNELNETDMILYGRQFNDEDKYFVELSNDKEKLVMEVDDEGGVSFFKKLQ